MTELRRIAEAACELIQAVALEEHGIKDRATLEQRVDDLGRLVEEYRAAVRRAAVKDPPARDQITGPDVL